MTGPEHYREAERLLSNANIAIGQYEESGWDSRRLIVDTLVAAAQVHATLALAAAEALYDADLADSDDHEAQAWRKAAGAS